MAKKKTTSRTAKKQAAKKQTPKKQTRAKTGSAQKRPAVQSTALTRESAGTRAARKRHIAQNVLKQGATLLDQQSARMTALADMMRDQRIAEIEIDGFGLLERGIDEMDRFLDNVEKGLNQARRDRERSLLS